MSRTPGFWLLALDAALAAVFLFGLQSAVFGLAPIRFLEGEKVVAWSRAGWAAIFGIALFLFVFILFNPVSCRDYLARPGSVAPLTVAVLFASFGCFSVAFWGYFRLRETPRL